jgi:predicted enzyme related to lactoylglutathione lyase
MQQLRTLGLSHVQIAVADVGRSVEFYVNAFGLEDRGEADGRFRFLGTPGCSDNLTVALADPDAPFAVDHFGFMLQDPPSDLDAAIRRVEAAGGTVVERFEMFPGWPTAIVRDPDGFRVQI